MKKLRIRLGIILLLSLLTAFGCAPQTKREVRVTPKAEATAPPLLPAEMIDRKIAELNGILQTKMLDEEQREMALSLLAAYGTIKENSQGRPDGQKNQRITNTLFTSLSQLEEKYFSKEGFGEEHYSQVMTLFYGKRKEILDDYLAGDYQGVIDDCLELEATFGPDSLIPEIGVFFAVALAKKGMVKEAINVGERMIRQLEGRPDLMHLRADVVEWQVGLGNREKAQQIYEKLTDNLDERDALVKEAREMVSVPQEQVAIQVKAPSEKKPTGEIVSQEQEPIEAVLQKVDELVQSREYDQAKLLLIKRRIRAELDTEKEALDRALRTVEQAEGKYRKEEQTARLNYKEEALMTARELIEEEKFDEAIARLEDLEVTAGADPEASELKDLAVEKIINRDRNEAAKMFLMARNTSDLNEKERLLLSSYEILKGISDKYPSSRLIPKINDHIRRVREELSKLGIDLEG